MLSSRVLRMHCKYALHVLTVYAYSLKAFIMKNQNTSEKEAANVDKILAQDTLLAKYSVKNAPLLGVPFSCKESFWVKGMPNSTGIVARKDFRAPEDAVIVKYMREAGAILLCVTNTSEVCQKIEQYLHVHDYRSCFLCYVKLCF